MIGYPFDSHVTYDENGVPVYDRAVTSAPLRKLIKSLFSDGVLPNPSTNLQVIAGEGMNVIIQPGFAVCNGCLKLEEEQRTLSTQVSNASYDRIDTVVMRLNDNDTERICDLYIVQGIPSENPVRPELTRNASVWEIGLADLFISKNDTSISNQRITDTRYETERCGIISSVSRFDTTTLYQQIQSDLAGFKSEEQEQFLAWFENIKEQLSQDAAGNLQDQISAERARIDELVAQKSNEVAEMTELEFTGAHTSCGSIKVLSNGIYAEVFITDLIWRTTTKGAVDGIAYFPEGMKPLTQYKKGMSTRRVIYEASDIQIYIREDRLEVYRKTEGTPTNHTVMVSYALKSPIINELHDLRIGAEGEVYQTAGDAVRGQFREAKESQKPFVIYEELAEEYVADPTYGDSVLEAKLAGREVLVCVQNKTENTLYRNFMPVLQYQLPDANNDYLTVFYLKDGIAENIVHAMTTGSFDDAYGEITMKLSKKYTECPLK